MTYQFYLVFSTSQAFFYIPRILFDMRVNLKRFMAVTLLLLAPVVAVQSIKQTSWGSILTSPPARQTGDPNAKVVIVEYSDFQCPSCALVEPTIHQLLEIYKGKIRFIYKYYPLTRIHKNAMPAAHAAECAAAQKQFWPYHDRLFQTQLAGSNLADPTTSFMATRDVLDNQCVAGCTDAQLQAEATDASWQCLFESSCRQVFEHDVCKANAQYSC